LRLQSLLSWKTLHFAIMTRSSSVGFGHSLFTHTLPFLETLHDEKLLEQPVRCGTFAAGWSCGDDQAARQSSNLSCC
jgi:hypothetical protein